MFEMFEHKEEIKNCLTKCDKCDNQKLEHTQLALTHSVGSPTSHRTVINTHKNHKNSQLL